ncbi:MAG: hypothetical protein FWD26_09620 [Treponema sp.]|nr:hypothetical protein [Treponema sp.]
MLIMKTCNQFIFIGIFTVFSIIVLGCTPRNSDRQIEQNVEFSAELNGQKAGLPPAINLIQHSNFAADYHPDRYARIWGWSTDGKAAYSLEGRINSEASYQKDFFILDLSSNNVLFSLTIFPDSAENWIEDESFFEIQGKDIMNALETHEIIEQKTDFLPFPMTKNNNIYNAGIINIEYGEDEQWLLGDTILRYTLSFTANDKIILNETLKPFLWLYDVYVCGYFLSPSENKILIVIAEDLGLYQHGGILYRFIGFSLGESLDY